MVYKIFEVVKYDNYRSNIHHAPGVVIAIEAYFYRVPGPAGLYPQQLSSFVEDWCDHRTHGDKCVIATLFWLVFNFEFIPVDFVTRG